MGSVLPLSIRRCWLYLAKAGARLHPLESILVYGCGIWFATLLTVDCNGCNNAMASMASKNALIQLTLFSVVVQIPCYLTGKMSNVDLAWPIGLVLLAIQVLDHHLDRTDNTETSWWSHRSLWVGIMLLLHGGRMAMGALVLFFPYDWPNGDLSRYQYARKRWIEETRAPDLWWLKQQQETAMQAYANSVFIAAPVIWVATNPNPEPPRLLEWAGLCGWLVAWILENLADVQKFRFQKAAKTRGDTHTAVLGHPPYAGKEYWLWTCSRHPNYFLEYMCWNSLIVMAIPSASDLAASLEETNPSLWVPFRTGIWVMLFCLSRVFYDCLLYWTGAEPAEHRSVKRRRLYKEYQKRTNVFWPFWLPVADHHRTPGWPVVNDNNNDNDESHDK